jgi:hypothetical protein
MTVTKVTRNGFEKKIKKATNFHSPLSIWLISAQLCFVSVIDQVYPNIFPYGKFFIQCAGVELFIEKHWLCLQSKVICGRLADRPEVCPVVKCKVS